jgi:hypothetical protein
MLNRLPIKLFGLTMAFFLALAVLGFTASPALAAPTVQDDEPVEIEFVGTVVSFDEALGTLEVEVEEDSGLMTYLVIAPQGYDFSELEVGDMVEVEGRLTEEGDVLATKFQIEEAEEEDEDGEEEDEDGEEDNQDGEGDGENHFCANSDETHPAGERVADAYGVSYEEVMGWFCENDLGFGQIMIALHSAELGGGSAQELLDRRLGGEGWGQILQDVGLIGRPDEAGPPEGAGPPDGAGPPEGRGRSKELGRSENGGRPEWAGGPPEWAGRPDDAGPPEWAGQGGGE